MSIHTFDQAYKEFIDSHIARRKGERKRRLVEGNLHAEKEMLRFIWQPAFGHFNYLHPEYEITDFLEGKRFIDYAYIRWPIKIAIEIDGIGPHLRDISRRQFCDQWIRQMYLTNNGWIVIRIGYDDIKERPHMWQQLLQQMIGRLFGDSEKFVIEADCMEKEVIRLAMGLGRPLKLADVKTKLQCGYKYARNILEHLVEKQWLIPAGGGSERIHTWRLNSKNQQFLL